MENEIFVPQRQKTYIRTCAPSDDSDQPTHSHTRAVWLESSLGAIWIPTDAKFLHAENEDSKLIIYVLVHTITEYNKVWEHCSFVPLGTFTAISLCSIFFGRQYLRNYLSNEVPTFSISYLCEGHQIQLTLVISTSLISNNRLSRSENLVPAYTWKPNNRWKIL